METLKALKTEENADIAIKSDPGMESDNEEQIENVTEISLQYLAHVENNDIAENGDKKTVQERLLAESINYIQGITTELEIDVKKEEEEYPIMKKKVDKALKTEENADIAIISDPGMESDNEEQIEENITEISLQHLAHVDRNDIAENGDKKTVQERLLAESINYIQDITTEFLEIDVQEEKEEYPLMEKKVDKVSGLTKTADGKFRLRDLKASASSARTIPGVIGQCPDDEVKQVLQDLMDERISVKEARINLKCSPGVLSRELIRFGLMEAPPRPSRSRLRKVVEELKQGKLTYESAAKKYNCDLNTFMMAILELCAPKSGKRLDANAVKDVIYAVSRNELTLQEAAVKLNCSLSSVRLWTAKLQARPSDVRRPKCSDKVFKQVMDDLMHKRISCSMAVSKLKCSKLFLQRELRRIGYVPSFHAIRTYTDEQLIDAISHVKAGRLKINEAAAMLKIERRTLRKRMDEYDEFGSISISRSHNKLDPLNKITPAIRKILEDVKEKRMSRAVALIRLNCTEKTLRSKLQEFCGASTRPSWPFQNRRIVLCQEVDAIVGHTNATPFRMTSGRDFHCAYCPVDHAKEWEVEELREHTRKAHADATKKNHKDIHNNYFGTLRIDVSDLQCTVCSISLSWHQMFEHLENVHSLVLQEAKTDLVPINLSKTDPCVCVLCDATFLALYQVHVHMNTHSNHVCRTCQKTFVSANSLKCHEHKQHKEQQSICCEFCGKTFRNGNNLSKHVKQMHGSQYLYKCHKCDELFVSTYKRQLHFRDTHSKQANASYPCKTCNKTFKRETQLVCHQRWHNEDACVCDVCGVKLSSKSYADTHRQQHFEVVWVPCRWCEAKFKHKSGFYKHVRTFHRKQQLEARGIVVTEVSDQQKVPKTKRKLKDSATKSKRRKTASDHARINKADADIYDLPEKLISTDSDSTSKSIQKMAQGPTMSKRKIYKIYGPALRKRKISDSVVPDTKTNMATSASGTHPDMVESVAGKKVNAIDSIASPAPKVKEKIIIIPKATANVFGSVPRSNSSVVPVPTVQSNMVVSGPRTKTNMDVSAPVIIENTVVSFPISIKKKLISSPMTTANKVVSGPMIATNISISVPNQNNNRRNGK